MKKECKTNYHPVTCERRQTKITRINGKNVKRSGVLLYQNKKTKGHKNLSLRFIFFPVVSIPSFCLLILTSLREKSLRRERWEIHYAKP